MMRYSMIALAASSLFVAAPAVASGGDDKRDKRSPQSGEKEEREKECDRKKRTPRTCKPTVPVREENKTPGPLDRAYNTPFL